MQIKTTMRYHLINTGKDVEKREPLYTVGRNVNWCSHCGKIARGFFKKLKTELPDDPAVLLLGIIYPKKMKTLILKDICAPRYDSNPSVHQEMNG